jgi:hypothetical protein
VGKTLFAVVAQHARNRLTTKKKEKEKKTGGRGRFVGETLFAVVARRSYTLDVGYMLVGVRNDGLVADRGLEIASVGDEFALLCVRLQTQSSMRALEYDVSSMRALDTEMC